MLKISMLKTTHVNDFQFSRTANSTASTSEHVIELYAQKIKQFRQSRVHIQGAV